MSGVKGYEYFQQEILDSQIIYLPTFADEYHSSIHINGQHVIFLRMLLSVRPQIDMIIGIENEITKRATEYAVQV